MITLLASIAGFLTAIIPEIFRIYTDRQDKKHELELIDRQMKKFKPSEHQRLEEIRLHSQATELKALYSTFKSGICWVDAFNAMVRPILAYCFFGLYAFVKYLQLKLLAGLNDLALITQLLWNVDDQAIFAGIISFYFGQRALNKSLMRKKS